MIISKSDWVIFARYLCVYILSRLCGAIHHSACGVSEHGIGTGNCSVREHFARILFPTPPGLQETKDTGNDATASFLARC
jgi:hypothetical protein